MNINLETLLSLNQSPLLQEDLKAVTSLDIRIDENNDYDDAQLSAAFELFRDCIAQNITIQSIKLDIYSDDEALTEVINHWFLTLESIPRPIQTLHLKLCSYAFDEALQDITMINVLKNAPAFQRLHTFVLENDGDIGEARDIDFWCDFFVDIFNAVSNKSSLNALTLSCHNLELFNSAMELEEDLETESNDICDLLIEKIEECTGLRQLSIKGNWLPDTVWSFLGTFIKNHQSLSHVSLNAQHATSTFDFVTDALDNKQLNDIAFMLTYNEDTVEADDLETLDIISNQLERLVGMSKLTLDIDFGVLPDDCISTLFNAVIKNPTLSDLYIDCHAPHFNVETIIESVLMNKSLTSVRHKYPADSELAYAFMQQTQANLARRAYFMPLYHGQTVPAVYTESECIGAHRDWLSLMAACVSRTHDEASHVNLNQFFFRETLYQLLSAISFNIPVDTCFIIGEYLTLSDLGNLSRVTGGYFFREKKPYVIQPPVVTALAPFVDEFDFDPAVFDHFFGASADDHECDHQAKRQKMSS